MQNVFEKHRNNLLIFRETCHVNWPIGLAFQQTDIENCEPFMLFLRLLWLKSLQMDYVWLGSLLSSQCHLEEPCLVLWICQVIEHKQWCNITLCCIVERYDLKWWVWIEFTQAGLTRFVDNHPQQLLWLSKVCPWSQILEGPGRNLTVETQNSRNELSILLLIGFCVWIFPLSQQHYMWDHVGSDWKPHGKSSHRVIGQGDSRDHMVTQRPYSLETHKLTFFSLLLAIENNTIFCLLLWL